MSFRESGGLPSGPPGIGHSSTGKQAESVSKPDFRHWLEIVDTNLEAVHNFRYPEIILDKVKRFKEEITVTNSPTIIKQANEEVAKIRAAAAAGSFASPDGFRGGADPWPATDLGADWLFDDKSRFMYNLLIGKLNTDLHALSIGVGSRNGFEL